MPEAIRVVLEYIVQISDVSRFLDERELFGVALRDKCVFKLGDPVEMIGD